MIPFLSSCFVLLLFVFAPAASAAGEWRQSLDGEWNFTTVFDPKPEDWHQMKVPGNWDGTEKFWDHQGMAWYRREFEPNASLAGRQLRLRFEAVYHEAEVFLNGDRLGKHIGGYTPFEFDVTTKVKFGQANIVTVRVDNTYQRGAWWPWGGISRSVNLIGNQPLRIVWQHIHTEPDLKAGTAKILVNYRVENRSPDPQRTHLMAFLDEEKKARIHANFRAKAKGVTDFKTEFILPKESLRLWHFDRPNLYQLRSQLSVGNEVKHSLSDRFGIRKIEVTANSFLLNGESVRLVGFNRVSDDDGTYGNTEPDELIRKDVDLMKECGANMARIMHYPQAPNLLDLLDEKGILVFCEIPVWQHDSQIITDNPTTKQWLREMIHRDYNHPSIIGWSVGNEMRDFYPYAKSMMKYVRDELDPHRLVTYVSDLAFRSGADEPIDETDIALINYYDNWAKHTKVMAERWPHKPIFVSEFGLRQLEPHGRFKEGFVEAWDELTRDNPRLVGASLWTFNDYRSNFKGTPKTGFRSWGVVDEKRRLKPAYHTLQKLFSPLETFSVKGTVVTIQPRGKTQTPSYVLSGYQLRWRQGENTGNLDLPQLVPGASPYELELPEEVGEGDLKISLVSPLGYEIAHAQRSE